MSCVLTFIKEFNEVQGVFQYYPHGFKDVTPQNPLWLWTHLQTCNQSQHKKVQVAWFGWLRNILKTVPRVPWQVLRDSPTGCLATEREVEYFKRGCSFSRTRQLAGAMAFCDTKHKNKVSAADTNMLQDSWRSQENLRVNSAATQRRTKINLSWSVYVILLLLISMIMSNCHKLYSHRYCQ